MLDDNELTRYRRQISLPQLGTGGQEKLKKSCALVVGAGGLGVPCASYLGAAGVGRLILVDNDSVELSNLPRQVAYKTADIGRPKAESLARAIKLNNPDVKVEVFVEKLDSSLAARLAAAADVVISCVDNAETRYILNDACVQLGKPLIDGAVSGFAGTLTVIIPGRGPCYQCIFPTAPASEPPPVAGPVPGIIGAMQALEAIKLICGIEPSTGRLLFADFLTGDFRWITVKKNPSCRVCGVGRD